MVRAGDRFRRKLERSLWRVVAITCDPSTPGGRPGGRAVLVPTDDVPGRWEVPVEDLEDEVGWQRE